MHWPQIQSNLNFHFKLQTTFGWSVLLPDVSIVVAIILSTPVTPLTIHRDNILSTQPLPLYTDTIGIDEPYRLR